VAAMRSNEYENYRLAGGVKSCKFSAFQRIAA
jgi:hypothetical protein